MKALKSANLPQNNAYIEEHAEHVHA